MNRIRLTGDEAVWLQRNTAKTLEIFRIAAQTDPKVLERSTYLTLLALETAMIESPNKIQVEGFYDINLSKKQKTTMKTLIQNTVAILEEKVIPKYKKKDLQDYCLDVETKVEMLKTMARKLR